MYKCIVNGGIIPQFSSTLNPVFTSLVASTQPYIVNSSKHVQTSDTTYDYTVEVQFIVKSRVPNFRFYGVQFERSEGGSFTLYRFSSTMNSIELQGQKAHPAAPLYNSSSLVRPLLSSIYPNTIVVSFPGALMIYNHDLTLKTSIASPNGGNVGTLNSNEYLTMTKGSTSISKVNIVDNSVTDYPVSSVVTNASASNNGSRVYLGNY